MKTDDVFPKKWLAGEDLPHDTTATIQRVVMEELHNPATRKKERKPVAYFAGKRKALILNRTNWLTLAGLYGDESDAWSGKRIVMGADEVDSPQGRVKAVRIRAVNPDTLAKPPAEIAEPEDDEEETAAATPVPAITNGKRPYTPDQLRAKIVERSLAHNGQEATEKQIGLALTSLEECFAGLDNAADRRLAVQTFLFGTGKVEGPRALALLDWLKPTQDSGGYPKPDAMAAQEARAVIEEKLRELGKDEFPAG